MTQSAASGPLAGIKIIEFAGIGPGPFCCMLLSDLGAEVIRIDRKTPHQPAHFRELRFDVAGRGRKSIALDLKKAEAIETCLNLIGKADAIIDPFRPGVMERLGLGPDIALARNPALVFGRVTGWGQTGPLAHTAGHDINYIAITGALAAIGPKERPLAPINLVGDYGGGAMFLAMGLLAGILQARESGRGQVVDCAMSDGAASLMSVCYGLFAEGSWKLERGVNMLDGGRPNYDTYECADGEWIAIAASETPFYAKLRELMELDDPEFDHQRDRSHWPSLKAKIAARFKTRTRAEWAALMDGTDACFAPVLDMSQAPSHPHNVARGTFVEIDGVVQPAPAPRFSATPGRIQGPAPRIGEHNELALRAWGIADDEIARLRAAEAL
jgi:alpha-methylacyl-CoA racemase